MAPMGEDGAVGGAAGAGAAEEEEGPKEGGLGTGGGGYVPPHLRKGAGASSGERMGGKYERDDLATLRVTNVSVERFFGFFGGFFLQHTNTAIISTLGLGICGRKRPEGNFREVRPRHAGVSGQGPRHWTGQRVRIYQFPGTVRCGQGVRED